jgi:NAD(P)-dependent dehydrogenase (short-subunit alcohol dehydrogenase family)
VNKTNAGVALVTGAPSGIGNVDAERLAALLDAQRAAFLRDGSPSLAHRRAALAKLKKALIDRRGAIEAAVDSDFGHRSRHETAIMEIFGLVGGIDYLRRNLRRFMRPERRHVPLHMQFGSSARHGSSISPLAWSESSHPGTTP